MKNKLLIKNKKLKTTILIKKNYINKFIINIAKKNEKVFCFIDSKVKIKLNFDDQKNIKIISILKLLILKPCNVANIFQIEIKKIKICFTLVNSRA